MDKKFKECMKPHSLAHMAIGAGLVLLVASFVPAILANALIVGVVLLIAGIGYDLMVNKG